MSQTGLRFSSVCAKVVLVCLNIFYMLVSVALVGFSAFYLMHHANIELLTGDTSIGWFIGLIVIGLGTFALALFGIISILVGKHQLLIAYMIATLLLIIFLLIGTGLSLFGSERSKNRIDDDFMTYMLDYQPRNCSDCDEEDDDIVNIVHNYLDCCGLHGPSDWYNMSYGIPLSCTCETNEDDRECRSLNEFEKVHLEGHSSDSTVNNGIWNRGCNESLAIIVEAHFLVLGSLAFLFAICQLITIFVTICLCVCVLRLRKHHQRIDHIQSVAYTPLDSYPVNTISNNRFMPGNDTDEELLNDDGEITIQ